MATDEYIPEDDPLLIGAVSKIMMGTRRAENAAYGTILSVQECQALWAYFKAPLPGYWQEKEADGKSKGKTEKAV